MEVPTLTADDLTADKIPGKVDQLFQNDATYKQTSKAILREQHRLQSLSSDDGWLAYLNLEQATNERLNHMLLQVAKWAHGQGRKSRGE